MKMTKVEENNLIWECSLMTETPGIAGEFSNIYDQTQNVEDIKNFSKLVGKFGNVEIWSYDQINPKVKNFYSFVKK